jgi:hypothetical protein
LRRRHTIARILKVAGLIEHLLERALGGSADLGLRLHIAGDAQARRARIDAREGQQGKHHEQDQRDEQHGAFLVGGGSHG